MVIVSLYGGLVSQIRAFYMGYKLARIFNDSLALDLSQYYCGYYRPYLMDLLKIPDCERIAFRGSIEDRIKKIEELYEKSPVILRNSEDLEKAYGLYKADNIYCIVNDCCNYDDFCVSHKEFFFRHIGNDIMTNEIMDMMELVESSRYLEDYSRQICSCESVGVHIRLGDFVQIGWMVEQDYDFYRAAIQWCREKLENPRFFIFSDNVEMAESILGTAHDIIYMRNTGRAQNDVEQLLCLSKCRNKILSKKSGFSLFAASIGANKWKIKGYTLIIEQMNLAENAGEKEYVNEKFNKSPIIKWEDNLSNCVLLNQESIKKLNKSYLLNSNKSICNDVDLKINEFGNSSNKKAVFLTFQTFSQISISGMEKMAKVMADNGWDVHFVGNRQVYSNVGEGIEWTLQNVCQAKDINDDLLGYALYPYAELNNKNRYYDFIQYICSKVGDGITYFIVRKKQALPPMPNHKNYNAKFIFVDFTDKYEQENCNRLEEDDLKYLYENADLVITYNSKIIDKYKAIQEKAIYVDINKLFPDIKIWHERIENIADIDCETNLYRYILNMIRGYFDENR